MLTPLIMEAARRVRLVFEEGEILSKSQRKQGLERCWILLKPHHRTFRDLSSYVVDSFGLHGACPKGILLLMGGFVLPPFESTSLLKNEDVICVRRKRGKVANLIKSGDEEREIVVVDDRRDGAGLRLLADEEFEKECGGYESEDGDGVGERPECRLKQKESCGNGVPKKRKASKELRSSKIKKGKVDNAEECLEVSGGAVYHAPVKEGIQFQENESPLKGASCEEGECSSEKHPLKKSTRENSKEVSIVIASGSKPVENGENSSHTSTEPLTNETKLPSRSARRKKAKRRWLRELRNIGKMEVSPPSRSPQTKISCNNKNNNNNHDLTNDQSKQYENQKSAEVLLPPEKENDAAANIVPIVIRPGHIRFEPLSEDSEQAVQRALPPTSFQWSGTTSKKKGQKWGKEKAGTAKWMMPGLSGQDLSQVSDIEEKISFNNSEDSTSKKKGQKWGKEKAGTAKWMMPGHSCQDLSQVSDIEEKISFNNFEDLSKLPQYTSFPKVGDIVAYRVIELSSSWCPELTCFRVGKLSSFDPKSNKVVLAPVREHPIDLENVDRTLYGEDGSLEIKFSSLIDVRNAKCGNSDSVQPISVGGDFPPGSIDTVTAFPANNNDGTPPAPAQENGGANLWDEISKTLSTKKAQLSQQDNWTKEESSSNRAWSFKALRGSALGPTMALLRGQNGVLDS